MPIQNLQYDLALAWRNTLSRPIQTAITILVVALSIALFVTIMALSNGLRRGIIQASDPFGVLVVGPKGSSQQLVLSTLLLQGVPIGNIDYDLFVDLQADSRVALAVPIALGDNVGGSRLIGTTPDFFRLKPAVNAPPAFNVQQGRFFQANFEAVLGANAAMALGLSLGDQFVSQHGVEIGLARDTHDQPYTVVGILAQTNSPFDNAVFTSLESIWQAHAETDHENRLSFEDNHPEQQVTAIFVQPTGFVEMNEIWRTLRLSHEAQAAFPGKELGGLFDLFRQAEHLLTIVGYLAAGMAALTVLLTIYSATLAREQAIAIMRSVGASRIRILRMIIFESVIITLLGALLGRVVGYGTAVFIATAISQQSAIPIPIRFLVQLEPFLWLFPLVLGIIAGWLPAILAYRVDVVQKLFPA